MKPSAAEAERHCQVLEKIAKAYEPGSVESISLVHAAQALLFVQTEGLWKRFLQVCARSDETVEVPTNDRDLEIQLIESAMQSLNRRLAILRSA